MSVTGAAVLFVVIWFMTMFVVLPIRARSQADAGDVVPGTPEGAPAEFRLGRTMLIVTLYGRARRAGAELGQRTTCFLGLKIPRGVRGAGPRSCAHRPAKR